MGEARPHPAPGGREVPQTDELVLLAEGEADAHADLLPDRDVIERAGSPSFNLDES